MLPLQNNSESHRSIGRTNFWALQTSVTFCIVLKNIQYSLTLYFKNPFTSYCTLCSVVHIVGLITNILPISMTINCNQSFHDHLATFKSNFITCLANDDMDYYEDLHN